MKDNLSAEQMIAVLDTVPAAVFVSAVDNKELLYANRLALEMFPEADNPEAFCYTIAGFETPCPFCHTEKMSRSRVLAWEYQHPVNHRIYQLSGKLIDWAGEEAHIEYILDITDKKREEERLKKSEEKLRTTQMELNHLINSIPGGIASYRVEENRFLPTFFSDGVPAISGHSREEYMELIGNDALDLIYEQDRQRVVKAIKTALDSGAVLDVSYRVYHKNGNLIWIHLNGRRMEPQTETTRFYAVFTSLLSEEMALANEAADGIYIIDKENYDLLYISENKRLSIKGTACVGKTCYESLHGLSAPCDFCALRTYGADEKEHEIEIEETGITYATRIKETVWNGIPAYIQYIRDETEAVHARREKERMEMYFQTLVKNLHGGIAVIRCESDDTMTPEYISEGFAALIDMTEEEAEQLYQDNAFLGIHLEGGEANLERLREFVQSGREHCEFVVQLKKGNDGYVWAKDDILVLRGTDGVTRLYCTYTDISQLVAEKEQMGRQYEELIIQHYRTPEPNTVILGHCNITQNCIMEIWEDTETDLLKIFGRNREEFFTGISTLIVDEGERQKFLNTYLNAPAREAFAKNETEQIQKCFIKLPGEECGRYVLIKMNLIETPETGDITGILTVTDVTDKTIAEQILHRLSVTSHDYVVDLDINKDTYTVLACNADASRIPPTPTGCYSERVAYMAESVVVSRDCETYAAALLPDNIKKRLEETNAYTVSYLIKDENGGIRAKNIMVSAIDLRLGRVSLVCTDITGSVREQQTLLNMLAYTFELTGVINTTDGSFTMYTRRMILDNLTPYVSANYNETQKIFSNSYTEEGREEAGRQFAIETMLERLEETPTGYEFVLPFRGEGEEGLRYKQINVLWGDRNHETICMVRTDVSEMLAAERKAKNALKKALISAENANRAKSDFLSAMSHDIRTPMNAIMGMAALAPAHLDDRVWMEDCLQKISISSKHLLSLINDVLDMSRIEREQIKLNRVKLSIAEQVGHLSAMLEPQVKTNEIHFSSKVENIVNPVFYGDSLRIDQILINLLSNAVKFTPPGGRVDFLAEEIPAVGGTDRVRYCFTVSDSGIGMEPEFLKRVFEPFARDNSVIRIEGTGLGLSIVEGLVELMKGKISVDSQPGEGSTFCVELEFDTANREDDFAEQAPSSQPEAKEDKAFAGRRFLIAEDNELNAQILCEILQMQGAQSVVEPDGVQVVAAFKEAEPETYDAILMDIQMPNMNGYEASQAIRALERFDAKEIPIIALTANAFAEDIQTAMEAGMTAHVAKPIDIAVLQATLHKIWAK